MNTSKYSQSVLAMALAMTTMHAQAAPMSHDEKDISSFFSADTQRKFNLYADTQDNQLVWYVPKEGQIAINGANTSSPRPRLSVLSRVSPYGIWAGLEQAVIGGAFDTTGNRGALLRLESEAQQRGWRVAPAPAQHAKTRFMLSDIYFDNSGRAHVECEMETGTINGVEFQVPKCYALDDDGNMQPTDVVASFQSMAPEGFSSTSTYIPFQLVTTPSATPEIRQIMMSGANWDASIQATTDWQLTTHARTQIARINIDWERVFQQASTYTAVHLNSCVEAEIETFFRRLLDNQNGQTGITIEYKQPDGSYSENPTNIAQFDQAVQSLYESIRDELFVELRDFGQSQLGNVDNEPSGAVFTLRANYEKLVFRRNESRYLTWNPGSKISNASTNMTIQCSKGGFGLPVTWDMDDPACRDIIGQ
ncbi:hypothetical protein [Pseudoalteromonas 'SMAR']|uniref:hypothetical protein n=1 Tax=Pseudoalteromonas 'SMAR' TaxID=3416908 RepID=UPI003AF29463